MTGADSINNNVATETQVSNRNFVNSAFPTYVGNHSAVTGNNLANNNVSCGIGLCGGGEGISTGAALIGGDIENEINNFNAYFAEDFGNVNWDLLNSCTGFDSTNINQVALTQASNLNVLNTATLVNAVNLAASSGNNVSTGNVGGGKIFTGNAGAGVSLHNALNNAAPVPVSGPHFGNVLVSEENSRTGAASTNVNNVAVNQTSNTAITNSANVVNSVNSSSSSGNNVSSNNVGGGLIATGNANAHTNIENVVNQGTSVGHVDFSNVTANIGNDLTGAGSTNTNTVAVNQASNVAVNNTATVTNTVNSSASSGNNVANDNVGGGSVDTGDASVDISVSNVVN